MYFNIFIKLIHVISHQAAIAVLSDAVFQALLLQFLYYQIPWSSNTMSIKCCEKQRIPLVADALNIDRDSDVRHTFHHEFSSILKRKYQFDMIDFMAHNGTGFEYF